MKMKRTFFEKARRGIAVLLIAAMMIPLLGGLTVYATELDPDTTMQGNYGGSTAAYKWLTASSSTTANTPGIFDIEGITNANLANSVGAYTGNNNQSVRTTFGRNGYKTVVGYHNNGTATTYSGLTQKDVITTSANGGVQEVGQLEAQVKVYPSSDQKWILVDYIIYNKSTSSTWAYVGTGTDVQIGDGGSGGSSPSDGAKLYLNDRGYHMVNWQTFQSFDCITQGDDPVGASLGVTTVDSRWGGAFSYFPSNYWNDLPSLPDSSLSTSPHGQYRDSNGQVYVEGIDSGLAYGWKFPIQPYETVTKRVAFAAKGPSYYVNSDPTYGHDASTTTGAADDPFLTIERALTELGSNMGYIYIQQYEPITSTISVSGNVTFMSADYDTDNVPISDIITLEKDSSLKDSPMFQTSGTGTMRFSDIKLKGYQVGGAASSVGTILKAAAGTIGIQSGTVISGNKVTDAAVGSAIDITGTANLEMNYGEITGNISAGAGAVNFNSSGHFNMQNEVLVHNNTLADGTTSANVYLPDGKTIMVVGELEDAKIGVTTESLPESSDSIATPAATQLIKLAPYVSGTTISDPGLYATQFEADVTGLNLRVTTNGNDVVLRRDGLELAIDYQSQSGSTIQASDLSYVAAGETVNIPVTVPSGYQFINVTFEPATQTTLTADASGNVTGTMPSVPVVITYVYEQVGSSIAFITNGGTPQPATLVGSAGNPVVGALPVISRYGYTFDGWYEDSAFTTPVSSLPTYYPATPLTYYAKWAVDTGVVFDYVVQYLNASGNITFQRSTPQRYPIDTVLHAEKKAVPGYALSSASVNPATVSPISPAISVFNGLDEFDALMPDEATTVTYRYAVDYSQPKQNLTVKYVSSSGSIVQASATTQYYPEDTFSVAPTSNYGYDLTSWSVTAGNTADSANLLSAVSGSFDSAGNYSGTMPNQSVEITYVYTYDGSGYEYTIEHKDAVNGADIEAATMTPKTPGDALSAAPGTFYGYDSAGITWVDDPAGTGTFTSAGDYAAVMIDDPLTVRYTYDRDGSKWRTITYKPGLNGVLSAGTTTSDVAAGGVAGTYETPILVSDGTTAGDAGCYNWQQLGERNLIPAATANQYYLFGGWFIDTNGNGIKDGSETYLTASDVFSTSGSNITVTADFAEDPAWWIDIYFAAGSRGTISGNTTYHTTKDQTWSSIPAASLPTGTPQVNYLIDGWYLGNSAVQSSDLLLNAMTYTLKFVSDPNVFGTALQAPDAIGNVDLDGSGMITVYGTSGGYQYVITDLDGNIVAVQTGSDLSSSLIFHDLYPGSRYCVYEVSLSETVTAGTSISSITSGNYSDPTEVLIPVVENNVSVLYDEAEDGKVKIVIDPADPDVSYALIDQYGNVVMTDGSDANGWVSPSGSNPTVEWSGLNANEEYIIVAVPNGQTGTDPLDKLADGTTIVADPAGEIDIPYFSIETMNGMILTCGEDGVGSDYYGNALAGDDVTIYADAVNSAGYNFLYWKVVVGGGFSGKVTNQEITFTMPGTNVVLCAYYERPTASPSNASVDEEVRGGNENEIALDPNEYEALEHTLTTAEDRELMDVNGAKVTYKVVFNKNKVKTSELDLVKDESSVYDEHPSAFTGAWGLDVLIERYVNGRKVGTASPSNATFDVIIQLDSTDVDMLDYELYELYDDGSGNTVAVLINMSADPEESGGLFRFTAEANCRYVLVYSKAFKVTVLNEVMPPAYYYRFKVRKGEAISDTAYYQEHYDEMQDMDSNWRSLYDWIDVDGNAHTWTDNDGVWHDYKGFSTNKLTSRFKEYDYDTLIKKSTTIYAYYSNNREELLAKREELEQAIADVIKLSEDYFLTLAETAELIELIRQAQEILNQTDRRANYDELDRALYILLTEKQPQEEASEERHSDYDNMHSSNGSNSKGGGSGGGGTGSGTKSNPYIPVKGNTYTVGVNGSWEQLGNNQWIFTLTGGTRLTSMWAWLVYSEGDVDKTGWYHFNHAGIMNDGWFRDESLNWYYCDTVNDGGFGRMKTGWHHDSTDLRWYYLDPASGAMTTGWNEIGGEWYYFSNYNNEPAYTYDTVAERWYYTNTEERPFGSLYMSETTPEGYRVDELGVWNR